MPLPAQIRSNMTGPGPEPAEKGGLRPLGALGGDGALAAGPRRRVPPERRHRAQVPDGIDDHSRYCVSARLMVRATGLAGMRGHQAGAPYPLCHPPGVEERQEPGPVPERLATACPAPTSAAPPSQPASIAALSRSRRGFVPSAAPRDNPGRSRHWPLRPQPGADESSSQNGNSSGTPPLHRDARADEGDADVLEADAPGCRGIPR